MISVNSKDKIVMIVIGVQSRHSCSVNLRTSDGRSQWWRLLLCLRGGRQVQVTGVHWVRFDKSLPCILGRPLGQALGREVLDVVRRVNDVPHGVQCVTRHLRHRFSVPAPIITACQLRLRTVRIYRRNTSFLRLKQHWLLLLLVD